VAGNATPVITPLNNKAQIILRIGSVLHSVVYSRGTAFRPLWQFAMDRFCGTM
jgi:hypothetical protein